MQFALVQESGGILKQRFSAQAKAQNAVVIAERKERGRAVKTKRQSDQAEAMSAGQWVAWLL